MKKILYILLGLILTINVSAQIVTNTPFKPNVAKPIDVRQELNTLADTSTIAFPYENLISYVKDIKKPYVYDGTKWVEYKVGIAEDATLFYLEEPDSLYAIKVLDTLIFNLAESLSIYDTLYFLKIGEESIPILPKDTLEFNLSNVIAVTDTLLFSGNIPLTKGDTIPIVDAKVGPNEVAFGDTDSTLTSLSSFKYDGTSLTAGKYILNTDQDTSGRTGQVFTYNGSEIELQEPISAQSIFDTTFTSNGNDISSAYLQSKLIDYTEVRIDAVLDVSPDSDFIISLPSANSYQLKRVRVTALDNNQSDGNVISVSGIYGQGAGFTVESGRSIDLISTLADGSYEWVLVNGGSTLTPSQIVSVNQDSSFIRYQNITQSSHGFTDNTFTPVYVNDSGIFLQANASDVTKFPDGFVVDSVDQNNFKFYQSGFFEYNHGLIVGETYYLGYTGAISTTPDSVFNVRICKVYSNSLLYLYDEVGVQTAVNSRYPFPAIYSDIYQEYLDTLSNYSIELSASTKARQDATITRLDNAGLLDSLDVLCLASEDSLATLINILNPSQKGTVNGTGIVFKQDTGFYSAGNANSYIEFGFNPSTDAINSTVASSSMGLWHYNNPANTGVLIAVMNDPGGFNPRSEVGFESVRELSSADVLYSYMNNGSRYRLQSTTEFLVSGLYQFTGTSIKKSAFINSIEYPSGEADAPSTGFPNGNLWLFNRNNANAPHAGTYSMWFYGNAMQGREEDFFNICRRYIFELENNL